MFVMQKPFPNWLNVLALCMLVACGTAELISERSSQPSTLAIDHWELLLDEGVLWQYFRGVSEPNSQWNMESYHAATWAEGPGGVGYGDGDDATTVEPTLSLYLRTTFSVEKVADIQEVNLHIDYDDAFVAYLNGYEIARAGIGEVGDVPAYNHAAATSHEAQLYRGGVPEVFSFDASLLKSGDNLLAVQVHNTSATSSDMSSRLWLTVGIAGESKIYGDLPDWFQAPFDSSNLPIVLIDTQGVPIVDDPRVVATMQVIHNGPTQRNHIVDTPTDYDGRIAIELRGSTSQGFDKKPYGFETQNEMGENNNVSLLGMPKENDWVLYAPYSDKSLMRNVLTFDLGRAMGRYAPRTRFCELFLNGRYQGVYVLMEKIKRDDNRVNIAKNQGVDISGDGLTGGYIVKIDKFTGRGGGGWQSPIELDEWVSPYFQFEYPEGDEMAREQKDYIESAVSQFENSLLELEDSSYQDYIDVASFIDFMLIQEISRNVDAYRLSTFLHKHAESDGGKIHMGPLWDFNLSFGNADYMDGFKAAGWAFNSETPFWWARFLDDPTFTSALRCRYNALRETFLSANALAERLATYQIELREAQERNFRRWPILGQRLWPNYFVGDSHEEEVQFLYEWMLDRLEWLDENIPGTCE